MILFFNKFPCGLHFFALYISVNPNNENSTWIWNLFSPKTREKIFPRKYLNSVNQPGMLFLTDHNVPFENAFPLVILHDIPLNKHKFIIKMRCWQDFNSSNFGFYETMSFPRSDAGISGKRDCHTDLNQQVLKKSR